MPLQYGGHIFHSALKALTTWLPHAILKIGSRNLPSRPRQLQDPESRKI